MSELASAVAFGAEQPGRFLSTWFGPPVLRATRVPERLPPPLVRWHEEISRWGYSTVMRQNQVPTEAVLEGDVLLVGIETQAVWLWGVHWDEDNPWVIERENEPGGTWTETGERLDEFLWHFTIVEAIFGCQFGLAVNDVTAQQYTEFVKPWTAIDAHAWRWPGPGQGLWTLDGALAWTIVNDRPDGQIAANSFYSIFVAARSNSDLARVAVEGIAWDWDSRSETSGGAPAGEVETLVQQPSVKHRSWFRRKLGAAVEVASREGPLAAVGDVSAVRSV